MNQSFVSLSLVFSSLLFLSSCGVFFQDMEVLTESKIEPFENAVVKDLNVSSTSSFSGSAVLMINENTNESSVKESAGVLPFVYNDRSLLSLSGDIEDDPGVDRTIPLALMDAPLDVFSVKSPENSGKLADASSWKFYVYNFDDPKNPRLETADKKFEGVGHCYIYVKENVVINQEYLNEIATVFNSKIYSNSLYFGNLNLSNQDNKVVIYITDFGSGKGASTMGFFNPNDLYSPSDLSDQAVYTNQMKMIYLNVQLLYDFNNNQKVIYHTLAHEMVHLLSGVKGKTPYETWIEEGMAEALAPFLLADENSPVPPVAFYQHFDRLTVQSSIKQGLGIFTWEGSMDNYTLAYTFLEYCRIQKQSNPDGQSGSYLSTNKAVFYKEILKHNRSSSNGFSAVLSNTDFSNMGVKTAKEVVLNFRLANLIQASTGKYGYKGAAGVTLNALTSSYSTPATEFSLGAGGAAYYIDSSDNSSSTVQSFVPRGSGEKGNNIVFYKIYAN